MSPSDSSSERLTRRLYAAWQQAVADNKLINQFVAVADDEEGRWLKGDAIAFGIKYHSGQNTYYARNLTQDRPIHGAVEEKRIEGLDFICQFNGYRALLPGGQLKPCGRQPDISPDPENCRFSCQNARDPLSLLNRDPLLELPLKHFNWKAYYNAAPIDPDGHFLWVPTDLPAAGKTSSGSGLKHFPQRLSLPLLEDAFKLSQQFRFTLLFFNSLHSGASVNHIHFQAITCKYPLPAQNWPLSPSPEGYFVLKDYPAKAMVFDTASNPEEVYQWIDDMQQNEIPFNLMFLGDMFLDDMSESDMPEGDRTARSKKDRIILIPREIEHEIVSEFPGNGIAALGMCGKIITVNRAGYLNASKQTIEKALAKMTLSLPSKI